MRKNSPRNRHKCHYQRCYRTTATLAVEVTAAGRPATHTVDLTK